MKFWKFFKSIFITEKVKSNGDNHSITDWEFKLIYESIKNHNKLICPNCESNSLKRKNYDFTEQFTLYCDFCGQNYHVFTSENMLTFTKGNFINQGINENFINLDVVRYKKLTKVIHRN